MSKLYEEMLSIKASTVTRETIERLVERLAAEWRELGDDETCHGNEDRIRALALEAIADGAGDARGIAMAALGTDCLTFGRWTS